MLIPSRADLFQAGALELILRAQSRPAAQRISRAAIFTEGTDANVILAAASAMGDEVLRQLAAHCAAQYLDTAESEDLDRLVFDRFSPLLARKPAVPAIVTLQFSRPNPAGAAISLAVGTKVRTAAGAEFKLTQVLSIAAGQVSPVSVTAEAVNVGTTGNVAANVITNFVTPPPDSALTVTNPAVAAGGADSESDAALKSRARSFYTTVRRGTRAAIEAGCLSVPGVASANVIEVVDSSGFPTGQVQAYVADAAGQCNSALAIAVQLALTDYRAAGVYVAVLGAVPRYESIVYRLRYQPGINSIAAFSQVQFLTVARVNALAPGETLPRSLLIEQARKVRGVIVLNDAIVSPAGDIVPTGSEIIKTSQALVTAV